MFPPHSSPEEEDQPNFTSHPPCNPENQLQESENNLVEVNPGGNPASNLYNRNLLIAPGMGDGHVPGNNPPVGSYPQPFFGAPDAASAGMGFIPPYPVQVGEGFCLHGGSNDRIFQMPSGNFELFCTGRRSVLVEKRNRRMIKNRESAARSRARKQAYTSQLETEIQVLVEENKTLKQELQTLQIANELRDPPKKKLERASSAPI